MTQIFEKSNFIQFLSDFDEDKRPRMASVYAKGFQTQKTSCLNALDNHDAAALKNVVHDLKSLGLMIGANDLSEYARETEALLIDGEAEAAFSKAIPLPEMIGHALSVIEEYIEETS